jgi:hypothetical protein
MGVRRPVAGHQAIRLPFKLIRVESFSDSQSEF